MNRFIKFLLSAFKPNAGISNIDISSVSSPAPIVEEIDALRMQIQQAQDLAEAKNQAIRHADRMRQYQAWVEPDAIRERAEEHERNAAAALEKALEMSRYAREQLGMPLEDPPLPPPEMLTKEMRGQATSTIRAMLRQENWKYESDGWHPPVRPGIRVTEVTACPRVAATDMTATPAQRRAHAMMSLVKIDEVKDDVN
jgi:hypothetical protein